MIFLFPETKRRLREIAKKHGYELFIDVVTADKKNKFDDEVSLTLYNSDHTMANKSTFSETFLNLYPCDMEEALFTEIGKTIQKMNNKRDARRSLKKTYEEWIKKNPHTDISTLYLTHMINYDIPPKPQYVEYPPCEAKAIKILKEFYDSKYEIIPFSQQKLKPQIKNVIFKDPATIVFWSDGTKTVVKTQDCEPFDPEKGLAMAISKKALGNNRKYYHTFLHWLKKYEKDNVKAVREAQERNKALRERLHSKLSVDYIKKQDAVQKAYDLLVKYGATEGDMILNEVIGYLGEALED